MLSSFTEFLIRLRSIDIQIRKAVNSQMRGSFRSVFKGTGLEFSDLRAYQYGDDIRSIDWNVSAKGDGTYVKVFREEKDQTLFLMVDVSASQHIGSRERSKLDAIKEIGGVLALLALREASHVGLYCFSDQKEAYLKPSDAPKTGYQLVAQLYKVEPISQKTDLSKAIFFALNTLKRRSVVILLSDFLDQAYERPLRALAHRHDLVVIHFFDQHEVNLPKLGIIPVKDAESGHVRWLNTSSPIFRKHQRHSFRQHQQHLQQLCHQLNASYVAIDAREDFVPKLIELFRVRHR